jgi:hypothetical protein
MNTLAVLPYLGLWGRIVTESARLLPRFASWGRLAGRNGLELTHY